MKFSNLLTDEDRTKLGYFLSELKTRIDEFSQYKAHLSNLWRINNICYKKTDKMIKDMDILMAAIKEIIGDK